MRKPIDIIKNLKAFVFDLDGTIVDSKLNFDEMRSELKYPKGAPILEHLETLSDQEHINFSHEVIHRHELEGVKKSTLMDGYKGLHNFLKKSGFKVGLQTRNSSTVTRLALEKFELEFDCVLTRDDCAPKPKPDGLLQMQRLWGVKPQELIYIGDFLFDLETAKNANSFSGLYRWPKNEHFMDQADIVIESYSEFQELLARI